MLFYIIPSIFLFLIVVYKRSSALKHFTNLPIAKSICSLECVAINEKRINVSFRENMREELPDLQIRPRQITFWLP